MDSQWMGRGRPMGISRYRFDFERLWSRIRGLRRVRGMLETRSDYRPSQI